MLYMTRTIFVAVFLTVLSVESVVTAQDKPQVLQPNHPVTFSLKPNEERLFSIPMKAGNFAGFEWLAGENEINLQVYDSAKKTILNFKANSYDEFSIFDAISDETYFVAPNDDTFTLSVRRSSTSPSGDTQKFSIEYNNKFKLPIGTKQKAIRRINGYDIKILSTPEKKDIGGESIIVMEKNGRLYKVMKNGSGERAGFYFPDDLTEPFNAESKREATLIRNTLDKTGDGIPDVMIGYYSGGNACCSEAYFFNLGETVDLVSRIGTAYSRIVAKAKNPNGGLIFEVTDTSYYYWNAGYNSPCPQVILTFKNGRLRPDFDLMKRLPPSLGELRKKAQIARGQLSPEPYEGDANGSNIYKDEVQTNSPKDFFWSEILDLIYAGNEELAWQFLDLAWPSEKQGKMLFKNDLKKKIADSFFWKMIEVDRKK
ncbi:hypothetical protein BH20ACI2_BH20ACI2_21950 [soil metagenome]